MTETALDNLASASPGVRAIHEALPSLAAALRPAFTSMAAEMEAARAAIDSASAGGAGPELDAGSEPAPADPPAPADGGRERAALARWLGLRAAAAMAIAVPDREDRERVAIEIGRLLLGGDLPALEEGEASRLVRDVISDPIRRDVLPGRIERSAELAVRHALLGGPHPDAADQAPRPEQVSGLWRRLLAFAIDLTAVVCLSLLVGLVLGLLNVDLERVDDRLFGYLMFAVGGLINVQLISTTGSTLGKLAMGIGIVRVTDGSRPDLELAFRREFIGRFLSQVLFGVGTLAGAFDKLRQTWGDRWAGTVVVRLPAPVRGRRPAVLVSALLGAIALLYLPALTELGRLDQAAAEAMNEQDPGVITLLDSVVTLVTRPVASQAEMTGDLRAILEITPTLLSRARTIRRHTLAYQRMTRGVAPWLTGTATRLDSLFVLVESSARSAESFAWSLMSADSVPPEAATGLRRAAQYASSDAIADRHYMRILSERIGGGGQDE